MVSFEFKSGELEFFYGISTANPPSLFLTIKSQSKPISYFSPTSLEELEQLLLSNGASLPPFAKSVLRQHHERAA